MKSSIRAQLVNAAKEAIEFLYDFKGVVTDSMTIKEVWVARKWYVTYLLDQDRFICPEDKYEAVSWLFMASAISQFVYQYYFASLTTRGSKDPSFLNKINGIFFCVVMTALRHRLISWEQRDQRSPLNFDITSGGGK